MEKRASEWVTRRSLRLVLIAHTPTLAVQLLWVISYVLYCSDSLCALPTHRKLHYRSMWFHLFHLKWKFQLNHVRYERFSAYISYFMATPCSFLVHIFYQESLCSLDLIVFSLLLPRLSTSFPPLCQKTQLSGMSLGPIHRKRETATEVKTDDIH